MLTSPKCQECLNGFRENARLVLGLLAVPGYSALIYSQFAEAGTKAAIEILGKKYSQRLRSIDARDSARVFALSRKHMAKIVAERSPLQHGQLEDNTRVIEQLVMKCGDYVHGIFEGVLKTVCIQAWGAIEVLFEDLLNNVVDENPEIFAHVNKEQFYFRKLNGVRKWYRRAFEADSEIATLVQDHSLGALAEIRHLLVHKGGVIDRYFADAIKDIPLLSRFSKHLPSGRIPFDGQIVFDFVDPAITTTYKLIASVDRWIDFRK